uniref:Protein kinase domain-containing protein n=1 Tax=Romanomermis culicivorax TaxID=13658 RepID=A0A915HZ55_ROMCU
MQTAENLLKKYLKLLNCESGESLEPRQFLPNFIDQSILSNDEKHAIKDEDDLGIIYRQNLFFLRILPLKGQIAFDVVLDIFGRCGRPDLIDILRSDEERLDQLCEEIVSVHLVSAVSGPPADDVDKIDGRICRMKQSVLKAPHQNLENRSKIYELIDSIKIFQIDQSKLIDEQRIESLGEGSYGQVVKMMFQRTPVAVKCFKVYDEFSLKMFYEETLSMSKLNHPNVLHFVGYVHEESSRKLWLVTEYVHGGSLKRFCDPMNHDTRHLSVQEKVEIAIGCLEGLDYLHNMRLCHKDIHPGNILVSNDLSAVKISDFGLSEFKTINSTYITTKLTGVYMYRPPEFASNEGYMRHATLSDVFSMGAVLCELFSEKPFWHLKDGSPYSMANVMYTIKDHFDSGQPLQPESLSYIDEKISSILINSLNVDLRKRISAYEMLKLFKEL